MIFNIVDLKLYLCGCDLNGVVGVVVQAQTNFANTCLCNLQAYRVVCLFIITVISNVAHYLTTTKESRFWERKLENAFHVMQMEESQTKMFTTSSVMFAFPIESPYFRK